MDMNPFFDFQEQPNTEKLNQQLIQAASNGLVDEVLQCIFSGASVYATNQNGFTPLMLAAKNGHTPVIQILLENEAELEAYSNSGNNEAKSAVVLAAEYATNSKDCAALICLLEAGASTDFETYLLKGANKGYQYVDLSNPIHWAANLGLTEALNYFLKNSTEINPIESVESIKKYTPLILAVKGGHVDTAKYLIESGANHAVTIVTDHKPQNLVEMAIQFSTAKMVQFLLMGTKFFPVNQDNKGKTPYLHLAVMHRKPDVVVAILEAKPDLYALYNWTALHSAIEIRDTDIVYALLNAGVNPEFTGSNNTTPLLMAYKNYFGYDPQVSIENQKAYPERYDLMFRLFSAVSNEAINDFIKSKGGKSKELVKMFDQEMKAIKTQQLAAFGLAEIKSIFGNIKDFGYGFGISALTQLGVIKEEPHLPTLPKDMVAIIMCQPSLYPSWYAHRIQKDIKSMLESFDQVKPKFVFVKEIEEKPEVVIFSSLKRKEGDGYVSELEQDDNKKIKPNNNQVEELGLEMEEEGLISKKSHHFKK